MIYVFDTNSLSVLRNYYPERFPSLWSSLDSMVQSGDILSVREVRNELRRGSHPINIQKWFDSAKHIFLPPENSETAFIATIFSIPHFQTLIGQEQQLKGLPVADPFIIASAKMRDGCVVTEEKLKPNAAKIPNVCDHFKIPWTNLEGFMHNQGWTF